MVLCGCPGWFLLAPGMSIFLEAIKGIPPNDGFPPGSAQGIFQGGLMICLGGLLILVPLTLLIISFLLKGNKDELVDIEPTGISQDDPIPPPS